MKNFNQNSLETKEDVQQCTTMKDDPRRGSSISGSDLRSFDASTVGQNVGNLSGGVTEQPCATSHIAAESESERPRDVGANKRSKPAPAQTFATEGGHWYLQDGTPYYTVPCKSRKGDRAVTIADARKAGAVPSVTTILKSIAAPGLQRYFERQIFDAVLAMEWSEGEDADALFAKVCVHSRIHSKTAADKGTALHGAIERFLLGDTIPDEYSSHVTIIVDTLSRYGIGLDFGESEESFAHPLGFGGKVDYHESRIVAPDSLVIDFKSKPKIEPGKRYGYSNHAMQLAAYRAGLSIPHARCINIFVGVEDAKVLIHEWPEPDLAQAWEQFQLLLRYWQLENNYKP